jgi:hypothetical protein
MASIPLPAAELRATDFLVRRRTIDTGALLILWRTGGRNAL